MSYYQEHKEERLLYQTFYNKTSEHYKAYQQDYFNKHKEHLKEMNRIRYYQRKQKPIPKQRPFPQYKKDILERMLKAKLKEIQKNNPVKKPDVIKVVETPVEKVVEIPHYSDDKYYSKKQLKKYQHSIPQEEIFVGFFRTPTGFALKWD